MVNIKNIRPGMFIRLVDDINSCEYPDSDGCMQEKAGTIQLVKEVRVGSHYDSANYVTIENDSYSYSDPAPKWFHGWNWFGDMIAEVYEEDPRETEVVTVAPTLDLLFGGVK